VRVERVATAIGALGQKFQALVGTGVAETLGFALFLGVAYLIYRAALRAPPTPTHPVVLQ
jgi:hypothetical protein